MLHVTVLAIINISETRESKFALKSQNCSLDFQVSVPRLSKARDGIIFFHAGYSLSSFKKKKNDHKNI